MGKTLRILSIIFFLLSVGALTLAIMLFLKRELLKGRTQKLETTLIQLAPFLEEQPAETKPNDFVAKDILDVTARVLTPEEIQQGASQFWKSYKLHLEDQERPVLDLGKHRNELMMYYKIDPITLKVIRDEMGFPITKGEGTMQPLLDQMIEKAKEQLARLNETREQLRIVREELIKTIEDLNSQKQTLREKLAEIVRLNEEIAQLKDKIRQLESEIADLQDQIRQLKDKIALQEQEIAKLNDELAERNETIERMRKTIQDLLKARQGEFGFGASVLYDRKVEPGQKGKVVTINRDWSYVVMEVSDQFIAEIEGINEILVKGLPEGALPGPVPPIELLIKRGDNFETFVTKVRLIQLKKDEKLAVADILTDWQQVPVQEGDVVFY